jgi:hypothetical protein
MSAIEVLKKEKELYLEKIKDINRANETRPEDIAEIYKRSIKIYEEFISALDEALLALEINENLINDLLLLANMRVDDTITRNEIISCLLKNKVNIVQGKDFIWERVGEQK